MKIYQMSIFDLIDTVDSIDDSVINAIDRLQAKHRAKHFRRAILSDLDEFRAFEDAALTYWLDTNFTQTPATVAVYEDDNFKLSLKIINPWDEWRYNHTYFVDDVKALQRVIEQAWRDIKGYDIYDLAEVG